MIDKVIVLGIRRANQLISDHEIGQMVGRCGRSYIKSGEATLVVPDKDISTANEYMFGKSKPISSSMEEVENVAFHCLPAIHYRELYNEETLKKWYSRSLAHIQGKQPHWEDLKEFLIQTECAKFENGMLMLTKLGETSFKFYYPPDRVFLIKDKLNLLLNSKLIKNPIAISWVLAYQHSTIGNANAEELAEYKSEANSLGLYFHCGELAEGYSYYCILQRRKPKWLKHKINELNKDIDRLFGALMQIAKDYEIKINNSLEVWRQCFKRKIPYSLGELSLEFPEASNSLLFELESAPVHRREELIKSKGINNGLREETISFD